MTIQPTPTAARGRVVLGVTGGIAAFRAVELLRLLLRHGCEVRVIMTRHATEFVHPRTLAVLSGHDVEVDQWSRPSGAGVDHVALSHWADLLLVAPATANCLAKMASGIADDALSTYFLAHRRAVLVAPAMNTVMWRQPAIREAMDRLTGRGVAVVPPGAGELACGDEGEGRLAEVGTILDRALRLVPARGPLAELQVLVTAGPTREPVDLVRVLTNRSSGRMGVELAAAARMLGAQVELVHGPLAVPLPAGVDSVRIDTAAELAAELADRAGAADVLLMTAAVADFRPASPAAGKLDRRDGRSTLQLEPVPDLVAGVGARSPRPFVVVFAAESGPDRERALTKMRAKGADAVVLNDVSGLEVGMETADNEVWVMTADGAERHLPRAGKEVVARGILLALAGPVLARRGRR